ncbi:CPBP family intramembrane glutamic endopeptidase [Flavobacterium sp. RHBU_3]|uniref:CPBP family intramembrane glutamic endopeptidase n=1 Tax=Flavobacterium sp. RHBU_3 TaxID=3391184 RepID=UPI003984FB1E
MKQVVTYFFLAYGISWLIWLPLYGPHLGIQGLPVLPYHHAIGGLGPLMASFICTAIFGGRVSVLALLKQLFNFKKPLYAAIALLSPFLIAVIAIIIGHFVDGSPLQFSGLTKNSELPQFSFVLFLLYNLLFFGFGEEVGWRGFALPRLQERMNALSTSLLLTVFWAMWHLPLFLYRPGYVNMDAAGAFGWVLSLATGSILLTWFYNTTRGSLLVCAIFHATIDIPFTAALPSATINGYMGMLITLWGIATIIIFKPKNLSRQHRITTNSE